MPPARGHCRRPTPTSSACNQSCIHQVGFAYLILLLLKDSVICALTPDVALHMSSCILHVMKLLCLVLLSICPHFIDSECCDLTGIDQNALAAQHSGLDALHMPVSPLQSFA